MPPTTYEWRGVFDNVELNALHAVAFDHAVSGDDWKQQCERHSLGWVCARDAGALVGFVNVAWDGSGHAFLIDTMVAPSHTRRGVGTRIVDLAVEYVRGSGCEWLHVDFDPHLKAFYLDACGFMPALAGTIALR